jgi:hypothetical protein
VNSAQQKYHILRRTHCTKRIAATLRKVGLGLFLVLLTLGTILYTRAGGYGRAYAAVPETLNFQARLLSSSGALVPDGNYSVEFKLYTAPSGGVASWTESQPTVQVKAGYLSVYLGSVTGTLDTLDWSQQYYLTMNVNSDGEMNPRLSLTSVPYAFRSGQADALTNGSGTLSANDLAQLAPSSVQVINSALAALRLNQTGAGLLAQWQGNGSDVFTVSKTGAVTAGTYNTNTFTDTSLTFGGAGATTIQSANNQGLTVQAQGTGGLTLNSANGTLVLGTSTTSLQKTATAFNFDLNNASNSIFSITNAAAGLASLDVESGITAGNANAFSVNNDGDITSVFTQLNGTSTANGGAALGSTSLTLTSAANFDVGNYVQMNSNNCGGTGINPCYAKITAKGGAGNNTLTITPSLVWANGSTVNEYHIPEIGGLDTSQTLSNRYGRGYFIAGVATGNGTTFYNEDSIESSLTTFDLLNTGVTTLNIGGATTSLSIGNTSTSVSILGNLQTTGSQTITSGGGLTVSSGGAVITGGIDNNSGGITEAGAITGITTINASGAITAATSTNTINGLVINSGALSLVTGITFTSGGLNLSSGGITNTGSIAGASTINASGLVTSAGLNAGVGLIQNSGGLTSTGSISLNANANANTTSIGTGTTSGQITIGGGATPLVVDSTNFDVNASGAISGVTTINLSGAISGATSGNTINGLIINSGALSGISTINTSGLITSAGLTAGNGLIQGAGGTTITGAVSLNNNASSSTTGIGIGTTSGQITIGGGAAPLVIDSTAFDVSSAGALSGITTIGLSGAITGATATNTINGLVINAGALSSITSINASGAITAATTINTINGLIINAGALSGITTLNASGLVTSVGLNAGSGLIQNTGGLTSTGTISLNANASTNITNIGTGTTSGQITIGGGAAPLVISSTGFDVSSAGALSGITTIGLSGAITGATATNTINGLVINAGALSGITTIGLSGAITGATATNTINGLIISSGALTGVAGVTFSSGNTITSVNNNNLTLNAQGTGNLVFTGYDCSTQSNGGALTTNASGVVACSADDAGLSDNRLKKNITDLNNDILSRIKDVRTVNFDFDCDQEFFKEQVLDCRTDRQTGVIAQELAQVFPELVEQGEDGYYRVKYDSLNIYTLKAVTQLASKVDSVADSSIVSNEVVTNGQIRLTSDGELQNITGLRMISGGASISGGINNNGGGISEAGAISGATTIDAHTLHLTGSGNSDVLSMVKDGRGVFTLFHNGALELKLDAANAFAVKKADGTDLFNINSEGGLVNIGSTAPDSIAVLLVLDNVEMAGDPQGVNGAQYYNTTTDKFRCYQDNRWQNCLSAAAEYVISSQPFSWNQPEGDAEIPGAPRVWADLSNASSFRMSLQVTIPGAEGAECQIQFATSENGPWFGLDYQDTFITIDQTGTLKTEWAEIKAQAYQEVILRAMCRGGNYASATAVQAAKPQISNIRLQVR